MFYVEVKQLKWNDMISVLKCRICLLQGMAERGILFDSISWVFARGLVSERGSLFDSISWVFAKGLVSERGSLFDSLSWVFAKGLVSERGSLFDSISWVFAKGLIFFDWNLLFGCNFKLQELLGVTAIVIAHCKIHGYY